MDDFWHKRIGEVVSFLGVVILAIYIDSSVINGGTAGYSISLVTAALAGLSIAGGVMARLSAESAKMATIIGSASYLLILSATISLLFDTGLSFSPYLFLWPLIAIASGLFGLFGFVPALIVVIVYIFQQPGGLSLAFSSPETIILIAPLIISIMLWAHNYRPIKRYERDPTDYKKPSSEVMNLVEGSETLLNSIGDGVVAIDNQEIIRLINPAAQTLLGWSRQDSLKLQYQSVLKLSDENSRELIQSADPIKQALNTNQEHRSKDLQIETKSGKKIFISLSVSPIGDAGAGAIVIFRDVTKERADEREQAEFISTASHEMRTPVASIEGYLGLTLNPSTATIDDRAREYIIKAQESATHLGRLFQDLLDVSQADDGRLPNNPSVVDVVSYAGEVVDGLQVKASEKNISLVYKPSPKSGQRGERNLTPVLYGHFDKDHLRELINNLTENAIKYTHQGEVSIDVKGDNEFITISVTDTGIGIPSEDIPHLFQKFYRVDNSDTREIGGTGLGLYLCRRLAETLGGRIWVKSVHRQGSTFFVELPRLESSEMRRLIADEEARAAAPPEPQATDDEAAHLALIQSSQPLQQAVHVPPALPQPAQPQPQAAPQTVPQQMAQPQAAPAQHQPTTGHQQPVAQPPQTQATQPQMASHPTPQQAAPPTAPQQATQHQQANPFAVTHANSPAQTPQHQPAAPQNQQQPHAAAYPQAAAPQPTLPAAQTAPQPQNAQLATAQAAPQGPVIIPPTPQHSAPAQAPAAAQASPQPPAPTAPANPPPRSAPARQTPSKAGAVAYPSQNNARSQAVPPRSGPGST